MEAAAVGVILAAVYWLVTRCVRPGVVAVALAGALAHVLLEGSGANKAFCAYAA